MYILEMPRAMRKSGLPKVHSHCYGSKNILDLLALKYVTISVEQ